MGVDEPGGARLGCCCVCDGGGERVVEKGSALGIPVPGEGLGGSTGRGLADAATEGIANNNNNN